MTDWPTLVEKDAKEDGITFLASQNIPEVLFWSADGAATYYFTEIKKVTMATFFNPFII